MDKKVKIATALKYNSDEQVAPELIAKGKGVVADNIIKKAAESNIKTYEDEHLSQQLYNLSVGDSIPEELYHVVAKVLAFVAELDESKNKF